MGCTPSKSRRRQTPNTSQRKGVLYKAIANYQSGSNEDLAFRAGEILEVLNDDPNVNWWSARNPVTKMEGYIPKNFVAKYNSLQLEPWYFGAISRGTSENSLRHTANQSGAFLVRDSETYKGNYVLSVINRGSINHYRIRCTDRGEFFIGKTQSCRTLQSLIDFHSKPGCGIPERLVKACVRLDVPVLHELSRHDKWEIERSAIKLKKKLGSGQFGDVYEGLWNEKTPVAVKTLKPGTRMYRNEFLEEARIMKQLHHPKLVQLYAVVTVSEPVFIVTELMKYGSLLTVLRNSNRRITIESLVDMAEQVAHGMVFLESKNFVHRDLAARNVLVRENRIVKIADFGLARLMFDTEYTASTESKFPIKWTAPEAANHNKFSTKSDVWSFGILLYEMITRGRVPYSNMTNTEVLEKIENGYRMPSPKKCPKEFYEIMLDCWHVNPAKRPTFETLQWKLQYFFSTSNEHRYLQ